MSHLPEEREVILGVDTHLDVHVAVLIDVVGRIVATTSVPTTALGYEQLIEWARGFGRLTRAGIEGTGTYGAALARRVHEHGVQVFEINRQIVHGGGCAARAIPPMPKTRLGRYSLVKPMPSRRRSRALWKQCEP